MSTNIPEGAESEENAEKLIPSVLPTDADLAIKARIGQGLAYDVVGMVVGETVGMPGYQVDTDICTFLWDINGRGGIPTGDEQAVEDTLEQRDTVVVRNRTRALVGPWQCFYSNR